MAFECNLNVTEDYFSNKVAAFEKAAAADAVTQVLCSESDGSTSGDQLFTSDDQPQSIDANSDAAESESQSTSS